MILRRTQTGPTPNANYNAKAASDAASSPDTVKIIAASI
jgi:hypothetical protein